MIARGQCTADGSVDCFQRLRQTELKLDHVSMLTIMGCTTSDIPGKLPGYLSPSALPRRTRGVRRDPGRFCVEEFGSAAASLFACVVPASSSL